MEISHWFVVRFKNNFEPKFPYLKENFKQNLPLKMSNLFKKVTESNHKHIYKFLEKKVESCLFLYTNLFKIGFEEVENNPYSANYYHFTEDEEIKAVFSLNKTGTLLYYFESLDFIENAIDFLGKGKISRFIGDTKSGQKILEKLEWKNPSFKNEENVLTLELEKYNVKIECFGEISCRNLHEKDFEKLLTLSKEFTQELGITDDTNNFTESFKCSHQENIYFGTFDKEELVSIAILTSKTDEIGIIGRVYTKVSHRKKGFAQQNLHFLLSESKFSHGLKNLILFTDPESNAEKLYLKLGFQRVGKCNFIIK